MIDIDYSNGNSFDLNGPGAYGTTNAYGMAAVDGTRPASCTWLFAVQIFRM